MDTAPSIHDLKLHVLGDGERFGLIARRPTHEREGEADETGRYAQSAG